MTPPTLSNRIITWFFILLPLCTGIYFFVKGATDYPLPWKSIGWSEAEGTITGVSVTLRGMHTFGRDTSGKRSRFEADIAYQYEVDDNVYAGVDPSFVLDDHVSERLDRVEAEIRAKQRFPVGAAVTVSYDPTNPGTSTLRTGWNGGGMPDFATGASCLALAGYIGWSMRRKKQ
jgi:hypothetical protein